VEEDNATPSPHIPPGPKKDYSLKDDQTLTISIPGRSSKSDSGLNLLGPRGPIDQNTNSVMGGSIPLLPPPPSAPKRR
jgi:adaptin ear-binding coat-associated protein 1/2